MAAQLEAVRQESKTANLSDSLPSEQAGEKQEFLEFDPSKEITAQQTPEQGLTNAELAQQTGIPKSTIERWKAKLRAGESLAKIRNPEANKWELAKDGLWYRKA